MNIHSEGSIRGDYRLLEGLGEALYGRTYLGVHAPTGDKVVVKELEVSKAEDWKEIELFERGARTLRNLDHPQIPIFYDAFFDAERDRFYLIQEYVEGRDLKQLYASGARMSEERLREFLSSMLSVLEYLQAMSPPVVHRDVKPSNIVMRPSGEYVLIDFDVVQTVIPDEVGGSTVAGTTGYMPPEQLIGRAQPGSDIFALGVTAVQLATGLEPIHLPLRRGRLDFADKSGLSEELNEILQKMIEPRIQDRYQGADQVLAALQAPEKALPNLDLQASFSDLQSANTSLLRRRWVQIRPGPQDLQIKILSRRPLTLLPLFALPLISVGTLWTYWVLTSPFLFGDLRCWRFGLPTVMIYLISLFAIRRYLRWRMVETGIEQTLTLSDQGVEVEERKKLMWWGRRRRVAKNWKIRGDELRGVYLQALEEEELSSEASHWRRALQSEENNRAGIIFVDRFDQRFSLGQALLEHENEAGYSTRLQELQRAFEAIRIYLASRGR